MEKNNRTIKVAICDCGEISLNETKGCYCLTDNYNVVEYVRKGDFAIPKMKNAIILELGLGTTPSKDVTIGIDINHKYLDIAKKRGIKTLKHDLNDIPFPIDDESVDKITAINVFEHLEIPLKTIFKECFRILRNDSYLVFEVPNISSYLNRIYYLLGYLPTPIKRFHKQFFSIEQIQRDLQYAGFTMKFRKNLRYFIPIIRNIQRQIIITAKKGAV